MQYTDTYQKGFLTGNHTFANGRPSYSGFEMEDPTYLGFYWRIIRNTVYDPNNFDLDYLPQGLFLDEDHPDSAIDYLKRNAEYYRANMMREFVRNFPKLLLELPWAFDKVSGLDEVSKIDPKVNYRAKDKKIIFEGNETISMRLTYLMDLYRKAAFDASYMRWVLPETQRFFSFRILVAEIRNIQDGGYPYNLGTYTEYVFEDCEFTAIEDGFDHFADLKNSPGDPARVKVGIKFGRVSERNSYGLLGAYLSDTFNGYMRSNKSWASDAFLTIAAAAENPTGNAAAQAANILDSFAYKNLERDVQFSNVERGRALQKLERNNKVGEDGPNQFSSVGGTGSNPRVGEIAIEEGIAVRFDNDGNFEPSRLLNQDLNPLGSVSLNQRIGHGGRPEGKANFGNDAGIGPGGLTSPGRRGGLLGKAFTQLGALVANFINTQINRAKLGNIYGFSLANIAGQLSQAASDPVQAAQLFLGQLAAKPMPSALGKVGFSQGEVNLLQIFANSLQNANAEYSGTLKIGESSEKLTGNPGKEPVANAQDPVSPTNNIGKSFNPPVPGGGLTNPLDKILFGGAPNNLVGGGGKELLSGAPSSLSGNPGKEQFIGTSKLGGNPGKEELEGNPNELEGNPGIEPLTGLKSPSSSPGGVELTGPQVPLEGRLPKESLSGALPNTKNPGKEDLSGPPKSQNTAGKEDLKAPPSGPSETPGKEELKGPQIDKPKLGNIGLE